MNHLNKAKRIIDDFLSCFGEDSVTITGERVEAWQADRRTLDTIDPMRETLIAAQTILRKYQARYHGAAHAQKHWEMGEQVLRDVENLLKGANQ